jgi:hypothetical protein
MRALALLALFLWQVAASEPPVAQPSAMQYQRAIRLTGGQDGAGQVCAVLDAAIFSHAAVALADLRIYPLGTDAAHELPYAITMSESASEDSASARVVNLGSRDGRIVFDLEMPQRAYTGVTLQLNPAVYDFIATATVSGMNSLTERDKATALGTFTLFDLTSQHLSRSTTIPLQESTFKFLHVELSFTSVPGVMVNNSEWFVPAIVGRSASVPPSREAQTVYSTVAETATVVTKGRQSVATFELPARVPVERVSFAIAPGFAGNFSREVRVSALTAASDQDGRAPLPEVVNGSILRVHASEAGREIRSEHLGVPAVLGANLQRTAKVEVTVENGDDQPLPITSVRLEMRQRKICFAAPAADSGLALYYGDSELDAPVYDYARLFVASPTAQAAQLGPEALNASYKAPAAERLPFPERHPEALWIALIAAISALSLVAMHAAKNLGQG